MAEKRPRGRPRVYDEPMSRDERLARYFRKLDEAGLVRRSVVMSPDHAALIAKIAQLLADPATRSRAETAFKAAIFDVMESPVMRNLKKEKAAADEPRR
ncbi:MAG: hypothetical protein RBS99_05170 [Rhodospirillales bacterium]|nr:hypothetical protein [Rhodospirillales bacterium]